MEALRTYSWIRGLFEFLSILSVVYLLTPEINVLMRTLYAVAPLALLFFDYYVFKTRQEKLLTPRILTLMDYTMIAFSINLALMVPGQRLIEYSELLIPTFIALIILCSFGFIIYRRRRHSFKLALMISFIGPVYGLGIVVQLNCLTDTVTHSKAMPVVVMNKGKELLDSGAARIIRKSHGYSLIFSNPESGSQREIATSEHVFNRINEYKTNRINLWICPGRLGIKWICNINVPQPTPEENLPSPSQ